MSDASHRDRSKAAGVPAAPSPRLDRRRFLMAFGAGAAGAASAPVLAAPAALVPPVEERPVSKGYRETEHVRRYYSTTRT
ncbi:MAG: hypothetical protein ACM3JC_11895 [Rudaea sp.]